MGKSPAAVPHRGWFRVPNETVDAGLLAALTAAAVKAYLILLRWADKGGRAWCSLENIARDAGVSEGTASRAVRKLIERGLARVLEPGRKGKATVYELPDLIGCAGATHTRRMVAPGGQIGCAQGQNGLRPADPTHTPDSNHTLTHGSAGGGDGGEKDAGEIEALRRELRSLGVWPHMAERLARTSGLTRLGLRLLALSVPQGWNNRPAYFVSQIEAGNLGHNGVVSPQDAGALVRAGHVRRIGGRPVRPGMVKQNDHGLYLLDDGGNAPKGPTFRAHKLTPDLFELTDTPP